MEIFKLKDQKDIEHEYTTQPHPAGEGARLVLLIMGLAGEPIGRLIQSKAADILGKLKDGELSLDSDTSEILKEIPWAEIAADIRAALLSVDGPQLFLDVLKYTMRDGQPLAQAGVFDIAYQQNYMELLQAVWKVISVNGFLGFTGSLMNA